MRSHLKSVALALALVSSGVIAPFTPLLNSQQEAFAQTQSVSLPTEQPAASIQQLLETAKQHYRRAEFKQAIALSSLTFPEESRVLAQSTTQPAVKVGDDVEVRWGSSWWPAKLERIEGDRYCITYVGYSRSSDECVTSERIRPVQAITPLLAESRRRRAECRYHEGDLNSALQICQQALNVARQSGSFEDQNYVLETLIEISSLQDKLPKVIEYAQAQLEVGKKIQDKSTIRAAYTALFFAYRNLANYGKAVDAMSQILKLEEASSGFAEEIVQSLEDIYSLFGDRVTAEEFKKKITQIYQEDLARAQMQSDFKKEVAAYRKLGNLFQSFQELTKATEYYKKGLQVARKNNDLLAEVDFLESLTDAYAELGNATEFTDLYNQKSQVELKLMRRGSTPERVTRYEQSLKIRFLDGLTYIYARQEDFTKARNYFEQAAKVALENRGRPRSIDELSGMYYSLGRKYIALIKGSEETPDYSKAIRYYEQALKLLSENKLLEHPGHFYNFAALGDAYKARKEYSRAVENYKNALYSAKYTDKSLDSISHDLVAVASVLVGLTETLIELGDYAKAIEYSQQQLAIARHPNTRIRGDFSGFRRDSSGYVIERDALENLGIAYQKAKNMNKAVENYQTLLGLSQEKLDRNGQVRALNKLASLFVEQNQPELAIVFYKQSVNVYESIRNDIKTLSRKQQDSYAQRISKTYRQLADLLITQGRLSEAQQVLELLKIQEINDFTKGTRAPSVIGKVELTSVETQIRDRYGSLVDFGQKLANCEQTNCAEKAALREQQRQLQKAFDAFVKEIRDRARDLRAQQITSRTDEFTSNASDIVDAQLHTLLIYPLVLPDKVQILWATKGEKEGSVLGGATTVCPLPEPKLNELVGSLQSQLANRGDLQQLQSTSRELYNCLIAPLEPELKKLRDRAARDNTVPNLVFVPDRATNLIPMSVLFDGKQYLIERYNVSNILSVRDTDAKASLPDNRQSISVVGFGLSESRAGFSALDYVPAELSSIIRTSNSGNTKGIYNGNKFLNQRFTRNILEENITGHTILHIATHGVFKPSSPRNSFLLLGDGSEFAIPDVQHLKGLSKIHLVVLSACETAKVGTDTNGTEVAGISSFFLQNRAKAVLASLWKVNDPATSLLMRNFYQNWANGTTKATALRQVQLDFIKGKLTAQDAPTQADVIPQSGSDAPTRADVIPQSDLGNGTLRSPNTGLSHPYYWAPFILIGNSK
ncbi:MAG: CHAT domain-containing protein [Leptolyngbyaceae cyanobacterium bins.349]|nr:CHAT domain-containing protein [Leptolyngbyaceae cyanobacterium bins.349]